MTDPIPNRRCGDAHTRHHSATAPIGTPCSPGCRQPSPSQAHCMVCHRTLRGPGQFDQHRCNGHCLDPAVLGLVDLDGLWTTPEGHESRAASAARLATLRTDRVGVAA